MKAIDKALRILEENPNLIKSSKGHIDKELIEKAEMFLDIKFPSSYKKFLTHYGFLSLGGDEIYGIIDDNFTDSSVPDAIWLTVAQRNRFGLPHHLMPIYDLGEGTKYCLDVSQMNEEQECPVVVWPINGYEATPVLEVEAENFGQFLLNIVQEALECESDEESGYFS